MIDGKLLCFAQTHATIYTTVGHRRLMFSLKLKIYGMTVIAYGQYLYTLNSIIYLFFHSSC